MSFGEKDSSSLQVFNSLRRNALLAAEFSKTHSPIPAKYQHNLLLLLKEVLNINGHLFTEGEKTLLGRIFKLGSSQLIFDKFAYITFFCFSFGTEAFLSLSDLVKGSLLGFMHVKVVDFNTPLFWLALLHSRVKD